MTTIAVGRKLSGVASVRLSSLGISIGRLTYHRVGVNRDNFLFLITGISSYFSYLSSYTSSASYSSYSSSETTGDSYHTF